MTAQPLAQPLTEPAPLQALSRRYNLITPDFATEISPDMATELLANRHHNRPMRERVVRALVGDIIAGRFLLNGATIVLCPEGRLLNGQHRCEAIRRSGVPSRVFVIQGISADHKTWATMDAGAKRTTADALTHEGRKNGALSAAIARLVCAYVEEQSFGAASRTTPELIDFIDRHPYIEEIAGGVRHGRFVTGGPFGAVMVLANSPRRFDPAVESFMEGVFSGASLDKGDPRLSLRNWFLAGRGPAKRGETTTEAGFLATARAWNAYAAGRGLTAIRMGSNRDRVEIVGFTPRFWTVPAPR